MEILHLVLCTSLFGVNRHCVYNPVENIPNKTSNYIIHDIVGTMLKNNEINKLGKTKDI